MVLIHVKQGDLLRDVKNSKIWAKKDKKFHINYLISNWMKA